MYREKNYTHRYSRDKMKERIFVWRHFNYDILFSQNFDTSPKLAAKQFSWHISSTCVTFSHLGNFSSWESCGTECELHFWLMGVGGIVRIDFRTFVAAPYLGSRFKQGRGNFSWEGTHSLSAWSLSATWATFWTQKKAQGVLFQVVVTQVIQKSPNFWSIVKL